MRKTVLLLLALAAGVWLWGHPATPPANPTAASASPRTPARTADTAVTAPRGEATTAAPTPSTTAGGPVEEGVEAGGFDLTRPPAGAPDATSVQQALTRATGYIQAINDYGYGDAHRYDFIERAKPHMTGAFYEEWLAIGQLAGEEGGDAQMWAHYETTRTRHVAETSTPIVTSWTATTLELAVPYRTADVTEGAPIPIASTERFARVQLVLAGDTWLVQHATADF